MNMKKAILQTLSHLPACTAAAFAGEEMQLPILVIADDMSRVHAQADGQPYLLEYVAAVDVYAADSAQLEGLCSQADQALSALGMRRIANQDLFDQQAWAYRKHMRYRALLQGDWIYQ